jgi:large subunit ribosomal protein L25
MIFNLNASPRTTQRKSDLTELRAKGLIPAVIYGAGIQSMSISLKKSEFAQCFKKSFGEMAFYEIEVEGKQYHTLLKDKQNHPVTREFLHLDFMVIEKSSAVEVDIPIKFIGEAAGLKEGGMMDVIMRTVKISCKADQIPEDLEINISALNVGDSLHVSDLPTGNWQYKDNQDNTVVVIHAKKTAEAEPVAVAPAPESKED